MSSRLTLHLPGRQGHFLLESGYHCNLWLELDRLFIGARALMPFAADLAIRLRAYDIGAVCGPLTGGAFLAQAIALHLDIDFFYSHRVVSQQSGMFPVRYLLPHAQRQVVEGVRVAVVDDAISGGSAARGTVESLEAAGATVAAIGALFTLSDTAPRYFAERGIAYETNATLDSQLWAPDDCPLCAAGMPLENV